MSKTANYLLGPTFRKVPRSFPTPTWSRERYFEFYPTRFEDAAPGEKNHLSGVLHSEIADLKLIGAFCGAILVGTDDRDGAVGYFLRVNGEDHGEVGAYSAGSEGMRSITATPRAFEILMDITDDAMSSIGELECDDFTDLPETDRRRIAESIQDMDGLARLPHERGHHLLIDDFAEQALDEGLLKNLPSMAGNRLETDFNRVAWIIAVLLNLKDTSVPLPITRDELPEPFHTEILDKAGGSEELLYWLWRSFLLDENSLPELIDMARKTPDTFAADCANFISGKTPEPSLMKYMLPWKRAIHRHFKNN